MHIQEVTEQFSLDRVVPYFQPIMDLEHNAVWRYECLARLVTPEEQTFLPSDFLHLVERQQSVAQLTETIFHRSAEYFRNINVAWNINVSQQDILNDDLPGMLAEYLKNYSDKRRVCIELTAATALADIERFKSFLGLCERADVGVFIDHFGSAVGNVNTLLELPVCGVKIAGKLISQLTSNEKTADFFSHLNEKAGENKIAVIAEHIEDKETLDVVRDLNIKFAQGFYFCQPQANT